jgi:hypothetical protein
MRSSSRKLAPLIFAVMLPALAAHAAPLPFPRGEPAGEGNQAAIDAIREALRAGRSVRVRLAAPLGQELTLPTPPVGTAYTVDMEDEGGLISRIVYAAEAGRALGLTYGSKATVRLTMKVGAVPGRQSFTVVAEVQFIEKNRK